MNSNMSWKSIFGLLVFLAISMSAGIFGSVFKPGLWYQHLVKPIWTPPNWIFAPVWTVLYLMMGISSWLVWREKSRHSAFALAVFLLQLGLNALWSWIFFGAHKVGAALVELSILWIAIVLTIYFFDKVSRLAAYLLLPYVFWVTYAVSLNAGVWCLN
jgi:translocator protein